MKYYVDIERLITYKDVPVDVLTSELYNNVQTKTNFLTQLVDRQLGDADLCDYIVTDVKEVIKYQEEGIIVSDEMTTTLTNFWESFCKSNKLPYESADELLGEMHMNKDLKFTPEQQEVVEAFIKLWDVVV